MKLFKQFKVASLSLCSLILLVVSCEKNPTLLLDTNEVESLVHLQRNIVNVFSLTENFDELIQSNKEDLALFEKKFSLLYQNYGEEFITLYNEIYSEKVNKDYESIFVGNVTLRSTPCYDRFRSSDRSNSMSYAMCIANNSSSTGGSAICLSHYIANDLTNHDNFERCLEDNYE